MTQITEYSPFVPKVKEDPYPYYAWLREHYRSTITTSWGSMWSAATPTSRRRRARLTSSPPPRASAQNERRSL